SRARRDPRRVERDQRRPAGCRLPWHGAARRRPPAVDRRQPGRLPRRHRAGGGAGAERPAPRGHRDRRRVRHDLLDRLRADGGRARPGPPNPAETKGVAMSTIEVGRRADATPDVVWSQLIDAAGWSEWACYDDAEVEQETDRGELRRPTSGEA